MPAPDSRLDPPSLEQKELLNKLFGSPSEGDDGSPYLKGTNSWATGRPMTTRPSDGLYPTRNPYQDIADQEGVPLVPPIPEPIIGDPNPVVAVCGACGRKVHQVELYSCAKGNCPIQLRAVF